MRVSRFVLTAALLAIGFSGSSCSAVSADDAARRARVVVTVRFQSRLSEEEIRRRYPERMPEFRALPGLLQKYYLRDEGTGEWSGIYLWDSMESVEAYLRSDLRRTIPEAYGVVGQPRVEVYEVEDVLRR